MFLNKETCTLGQGTFLLWMSSASCRLKIGLEIRFGKMRI
jgi:hypothetical protein